MKVFISYSSQDEQYVQIIAKSLKDQGIDVWYDEWSIGVGDSLVSKIEAGIVDSNVLSAVPVVAINACGRMVVSLYFRKHLRTMLRHKKDNSN